MYERTRVKSAFGLMHAQVHAQDLLDAPHRHRSSAKYRAPCDFVAARLHARSRLVQCPRGGALRFGDAPLDDRPRLGGRLALRRMIGLSCPLRFEIFDELDAPTLDDEERRVRLRRERNESRPAGMRFETEGDAHRRRRAKLFFYKDRNVDFSAAIDPAAIHAFRIERRGEIALGIERDDPTV